MASERDVFPHITSVSFRSKITQKWEKCQPPLIKSSLRDVTLPQKELTVITGRGTGGSKSPEDHKYHGVHFIAGGRSSGWP